jgi:heme exporter protein A
VSGPSDASPRNARIDLVADRLACRRGGRTLFRDLSFTVAHGSGLILTGRNGTGKTSLLRILAGLLPPSGGSVNLAGGDGELPLAEEVHFVGTKDGLKPPLTPREHVQFWFDLAGADFLAAWIDHGPGYFVDVVLATGLLHDCADIPVALLSSGQRKRLSLLRLFVPDRRVWLLDEPMNTLDDIAQSEVRGWITRFMASGGIAVVATHVPIKLPYVTELCLGPSVASPGTGSPEPGQ